MAISIAAKQFVFHYRWVMFVVLVTAYFFVYFQRMTINAIGGDIVADTGGSKEFLSSIYFWTYAFMQLPSGLLADRFGPRRASAAFLALAAAGSLVTVVSVSFWEVAAGKMMIAAGMAVVYIPLMKIIAVWFPKQDFAQLNAVVIAVGNVGALAAAAPLRYLADAVGWREVFLILGVVSLVLALLCLLLVRDHPHALGKPSLEEIVADETGCAPEERSDAKVPLLTGLKAVFGSGRRFWGPALAYLLIYGTIMVFQGTVSIAYFGKHVYAFALAAWFITALGLGKIVSTLVIGRLVSRGVIRSKKKVLIVGAAAFLSVWAVIWLAAGHIESQLFWGTVCTLFGFFAGFMTLSFAQVKEWFPIAISGTAMAAMNLMLFLGAAIMTTLAGVVLNQQYVLAHYTELWALMCAAALGALLLVLWSRERQSGDKLIEL